MYQQVNHLGHFVRKLSSGQTRTHTQLTDYSIWTIE